MENLLRLKAPAKEDRPKVVFTEDAYKKMKALVKNCDKEIAWHGTVTREGLTFTVKDILVYPQMISGATVASDDEEYTPWLEGLDDDTFNSIRLQGHSHVNMTVSPSGTDDNYYETHIQQIKDYYIYMILNKSDKIWINIYDVKANVVYESTDVDVNYEHDGFDYDAWYKEQYDTHIDEKIYTFTSYVGKVGQTIQSEDKCVYYTHMACQDCGHCTGHTRRRVLR